MIVQAAGETYQSIQFHESSVAQTHQRVCERAAQQQGSQIVGQVQTGQGRLRRGGGNVRGHHREGKQQSTHRTCKKGKGDVRWVPVSSMR